MKRALAGFCLLGSVLAGSAAEAPTQVSAQSFPPPKPAPVKPVPNKPPQAAPAKGPGACALVTAGTRMEAYGFTHVVTLKNGCDKPVACEVWTDVDPTPRHVLSAAPGESADVVTRIGSPASAVSAFKECRFR